jgi:hypothetical protein
MAPGLAFQRPGSQEPGVLQPGAGKLSFDDASPVGSNVLVKAASNGLSIIPRLVFLTFQIAATMHMHDADDEKLFGVGQADDTGSPGRSAPGHPPGLLLLELACSSLEMHRYYRPKR